MMFSRFQYPSFKGLNWKTTRSIPRFIAIVLIVGFTLLNYYWMPAVIFLVYLLYGFLRPFLSRGCSGKSRKRSWRRSRNENSKSEI